MRAGVGSCGWGIGKRESGVGSWELRVFLGETARGGGAGAWIMEGDMKKNERRCCLKRRTRGSVGFLDGSACACRGRGKFEGHPIPLHRAASAAKAPTRSGIVCPVFHCSFPIADVFLYRPPPFPVLCHSRHQFLQEPTDDDHHHQGVATPAPSCAPLVSQTKARKTPPGLRKPCPYATGKHTRTKKTARFQASTKPSTEG